MGWQIVRHGVGLLLRNLGPALRVSVGPLLIALLVLALLGGLGLGALYLDPTAGQAPGEPGAGALGLALSAVLMPVLLLFTFSWVAVAWHRYVLREEVPGLLPRLHPRLVWPYLGRSIVIALALMLVALPVALVLAPILGSVVLSGGSVPDPGPGFATRALGVGAAFALLLSLLLGWVGTRLSLTLPARAVGKPITFGESWAATAPASGAIFAAVLILTLVNVALGLVFTLVLGQGLTTTVLDFIVRWATAMLGISILTTLYGHLVERRPLTP